MENIRLAFQGIWGHKMRSFLTMLGIIIGIASIITIVSTIKGTNEQIKENLIGSGSNVVQVSLYQDDWEYDMTYSPLPEGVRCLEDSLRDTLNRLSGVEEVSFFNRRNWSDFVTAGSNRFSGETYGIDTAFFRVCGYTVT
jgi:putative ABC transport system permease protein